MEFLHFSALFRSLLPSHAEARSKQVFSVPLERVLAREEISTVVTKEDFEWV